MKKYSLIESIKVVQPQLWEVIQSAAKEGLIVLDEGSDAITATNRLLLTYPGLHEVLAFITDQWVEAELEQENFLSALLHPQPSPI